MSTIRTITSLLSAFAATVLVGSPAGAAPAKLSAAEIVDRNVAARGGLEHWRSVQTLAWSGKMEAGGNNQRYLKVPGMPTPPPASKEATAQVQLPFSMQMQRGHKSRLEIEFKGENAVQVYDGTQGWKVRPYLNRHEVEPFTAEELKVAAEQADLDGQLVDYTAKGSKVELAGVESVEGKDAYNLKLTLKNGHAVHVWVDAHSFLEVKVEGTPRRLDAKVHPVSIYLRDYKAVNGLMMPHVIETSVQGVQRTEKILIESVVVNPHLDVSRFAKPS